jgi:hypothetical protein
MDPATCLGCEGPVSVVNPLAAGTSPPGICMAASGGSYENSLGLLVWNEESPAASVEQDVRGRLIEAFPAGSATVDLGGGCGLGGTLTTPLPAALGNGYFSLQLAGADPSAAISLINLNTPQSALGCGSCQILPFFITLQLPVANGASSLLLPIPCDPVFSGAIFEVQWAVVTPSTSPCSLLPAISFSNRLRIQIV